MYKEISNIQLRDSVRGKHKVRERSTGCSQGEKEGAPAETELVANGEGKGRR